MMTRVKYVYITLGILPFNYIAFMNVKLYNKNCQDVAVQGWQTGLTRTKKNISVREGKKKRELQNEVY